MRILSFWQIAFFLVLASCTMGPHYTKCPEVDVPDKWNSPLSEGMDAETPACFVWWESLNDPTLTSLIKQAAQQNLDLFIAGTRILEARAERMGKLSALYPHIDASASMGRVHYGKDAMISGRPEINLPFPRKHERKRNFNFFEIGFDAKWELDFFGVTKHQMNAAQAKVESAEENLLDTWVTLSAEVARNYIELRSAQQRRQILLKNIETQEDALHLTEELVRIGILDQFDFQRASNELSLLLAEKPTLELAIDKAIHRLSILLGFPPEELFAELLEPRELPTLPCERPIGLPSELLRRRPDVRRAERDLAAATEMVGSAVASLFPRLSLFGFIGDISSQLTSLLKGSSATWFAAPQLLMPIFNSRVLTQDVNFAKIRTRQALFQYQKTVLQALEETENAIASFHYELERKEALTMIFKGNEKSHQLLLQLYERGIKDFLEVRAAERAVWTSEEALVQEETILLLHYVSLYKALGGGWNIPQVEECCCEQKN